MRRWILVGLALVMLAGGALRAREAAHPDPRLSPDERSYAAEAYNLPRGTYGNFRWPPGAPALFAASRWIDDSPGLPAAYWLQAVAGTALIGVCFAVSALVAGPVAGLVAAAVVATYPPLIVLTGQLQSEALGALLVALAVLASTWALTRDGRPRWWAAAGVLFGAAVLTRTDLLVAPPLVALVVVLGLRRHEGLGRAAGGAAVLLAAFALTLTPWVAWASHHTGRLTPVTEGDAAALFVGTYLPADGTTDGVKRAFGDEVRARDPRLRGVRDRRLEASRVLDVVAARHPGLQREAALRAEARANLRRYALGEPAAFGAMMLDKVRRTWLVSSRSGAATKSPATRAYHAVLVLACCALLAFAVARRRSVPAAVCAALVVSSMAVHAVFVAKPRYNLPLVGVLVAGASMAAARPYHR